MPLPENQASGGLFSCTGSSAGCRGQKTQTNGIGRPTAVSFFFLLHANDFIKLHATIVTIRKWPPHLKRRNKKGKGEIYETVFFHEEKKKKRV